MKSIKKAVCFKIVTEPNKTGKSKLIVLSQIDQFRNELKFDNVIPEIDQLLQYQHQLYIDTNKRIYTVDDVNNTSETTLITFHGMQSKYLNGRFAASGKSCSAFFGDLKLNDSFIFLTQTDQSPVNFKTYNHQKINKDKIFEENITPLRQCMKQAC